MSDLGTRVVVPAADAMTGAMGLSGTPHHEPCDSDGRPTLPEVALGTASAPTYVRTMRSSDRTRIVDDGLWANNPAMTGLVEAVGVLGARLDHVALLSSGTTGAPADFGRADGRIERRACW